jgi:hypothetical protein
MRRVTQAIDAAQMAAKDLRSGLSKGSRDLVRDLERTRTLRDARANARRVGKAVSKDLGQAVRADTGPRRKSSRGPTRRS